jgi:hypothetical protein
MSEHMAHRVMLFVIFAIMLTLFVPATRVEENMLGQFGADFNKVRVQGLALFGLPIKVPRRIRPTAIPVINNSDTTANTPQNDTQAADLILTLLERAELVQMVTVVPTPTATTTPIPTRSATATIHITPQPSVTMTIPVATVTPQDTATATIEPATVTPVPQITATDIPASPTAVVLLPRSILDGFRDHMPPKGYWWNNSDGIYIAIGSFKYQKSFYGNDAESTQKFIAFSITIRNNRNPDEAAVIIDPAKMTLVDLDGRQTTVHRDYRNLSSALLPNTIAPGQSDGGQLIFVAHQYAAPAQLIVTYTNANHPNEVHTQTIELRVWPTVD